MVENKNNPIEEKKNNYKYFWPIVIFSILLVAYFWFKNYEYGMTMDKDLRGVFGDMFGAVNAVFSGLAFAGIIISLYLQRIDLKNQFDEIQKTNLEFQIQNDTMQIQKFENQYYKMIDSHKANVEEISIPFFDLLDGSITSKDNKQIEQKASTTVLREITGKKGFVDMGKELDVCISSTVSILSSDDRIYDMKDILPFAYKIFFWGVYSDFSTSDKISDNHQKLVKDFLKQKQKQFKRNLIEDNKQDINTRYVPFQGHESRLAHYYRHLFQTVKYVVQQENNNLISYQETRQYLRVLRAQLSNAEQLLLYYNYYCGFGQPWDRLGGKYQFFTKYRMIHNIPIDRVKIIESPRLHFNEYIKNYATKEDPLFEWGDYNK